MTSDRYDFAAVAAALKRALRKKNLSYRELGDAVGMSESGIKKIMSGDDVSLARLGAICRAIDVDLVELLSAAWSPPPAPVRFSAEQEAFLAAEPACHSFLEALLSYDFDVDAVMRDFELDRRSADHYVDRLEENELVRVTAEGRVKPAFADSGWLRYRAPDSEDKIVAALRAALAGPRERRCVRNGRVRLTAKHLEELERELLDLLLRYQAIGTRDELHVDPENLVSVWVLAATARQELREVLRIPPAGR